MRLRNITGSKEMIADNRYVIHEPEKIKSRFSKEIFHGDRPLKIEIGMGIHGEQGIEVCDMMSADEIADLVVSKILDDMPIPSGSRVSVMVNGLGATPKEELLIVYRRVNKILTEKGITLVLPHIGEYATSMEMAGLSVTIMKLDEELESLMRAPAESPFYTNSNII